MPPPCPGLRVAGPLSIALLSVSCDVRTSTSSVLSAPGSIGTFVWHDLDCDGVQGSNEPGLGGVTVVLTSPDGSTQEVVSDAAGRVVFERLQPGTYSLSYDAVGVPEGFTPTECGQGDDPEKDSDCAPVAVDLGVEQDLSFDFGFLSEPCLERGELGGLAWRDLDCDGLQGPHEPGLADIRVLLEAPSGDVREDWTNADGRFGFLDLLPGTYVLCYDAATVPLGLEPTLCDVGSEEDIDSDCCPAEVELGAGQGLSVDFGFRNECCEDAGVVGGFTWHDLNCNGLQNEGEFALVGVRVLLADDAGGLHETFSDEIGRFTFPGLCPGVYQVSFDPESVPAGFVPTPCGLGQNPDNDSDCVPAQVRLEAGAGVSVDFGFQSSCCLGSGRIGNRVWHDVDWDGLQGENEPGLAGVRVLLESLDGGAGPLETTTDAGGRYGFEGLCRGTYRVSIDLESLPGAFEPTACGVGDEPGSDSDCTGVVVLPYSVSIDNTIDFGFRSNCVDEPGSIVSRVWQDLDCDGRQEPNEPGLAGVRLLVIDSGEQTYEAVTNADGEAVLLGLCAGSYSVCFDPETIPPGLVPTACEVGAPNKDSNCCPALVDLADGAYAHTSTDFGFASACCDGAGRIGDLVWHDLDGDGLQTPGEPGIAGVRVLLVGGPSEVLETYTDEDGRYEFPGVCAGTYTLSVDEASLPPGLAPTPCEQAGQPLLDSNCEETVIEILDGVSIDLSVDFGFVSPLGGPPPRGGDLGSSTREELGDE